MSIIRTLAIAKAAGGGGGGDITTQSLSVTANGQYVAPSGKAYTPVNVSVPNTYTAADEGKVVSNGALAAQTPYSVASNGTYDTTAHDEVTVNVTPSLSALSVTENGTYTPSGFDGYSQVTVDVQGGGGGDHDAEDGLVERTLSTYTNGRVTSIGPYAFASYSTLVTVNFPLCATISTSAFMSCSGLTTAIFPACTNVGSTAFINCSNLTAVSFPTCKSMKISAFAGCDKLTIASFPTCQIIGSNAFYSCKSLATANFPALNKMSSSAFAYCNNLLSVYLTGSSVASLGNSTAFYSTPIAGNTASTGGVYGSIYVPASLVSSYQSATNWAYFSERFVGLTDAQIAALEG